MVRPAFLRHLHELVDHVALRGDDEDLLPSAALALARGRREDLEVQDRLVERDGDGFLRLELDGGAEFLGIDDRELHGAHDDLLVGDAHREPLAGEPGCLPERLELCREPLDVDDLALEHETVGERSRRDRHQRVALTASLDLGADHRSLFDVDAYAHRVHGHTRPSACLALAPVSAPLRDTFRHSFRRIGMRSLPPTVKGTLISHKESTAYRGFAFRCRSSCMISSRTLRASARAAPGKGYCPPCQGAVTTCSRAPRRSGCPRAARPR